MFQHLNYRDEEEKRKKEKRKSKKLKTYLNK